MFGKRRSYAEAVQGRRRLARRIGIIFLVFLSFQIISSLFLAAYAIKSGAMAPTLLSGDRILASPLAYGPRTIFGKLPGIALPERGDIAIVEPAYSRRTGFWEGIADSLVRFVTLQLVSPTRNGQGGILPAPALLRVIALPGDTVQMDDFVFKIKPAGGDQFLTEFELSPSRYDISHEDPPKDWLPDLPGSGYMKPRLLGKDEYFLAGDARSASSDSRAWGSVSLARFLEKAIVRYWPLKGVGGL